MGQYFNRLRLWAQRWQRHYGFARLSILIIGIGLLVWLWSPETMLTSHTRSVLTTIVLTVVLLGVLVIWQIVLYRDLTGNKRGHEE